MTDEAAFLRAIIANPDEDVTRLVYADWLDERGEPGDAERAELIRVECELAKWLFVEYNRVGELQARESALLIANPNWRPLCSDCRNGRGVNEHGEDDVNCPTCGGTGYVGDFERGFVKSVKIATLADVMTNECPQCRGPNATHYNNPSDPCTKCEGRTVIADYRPTDYGRELVTRHPIVEVWVGDREPGNSGDIAFDDSTRASATHAGFWWGDQRPEENGRDRPWWLPSVIFKLMERLYSERKSLYGCFRFPTRETADLALARVVAAWLRAECGFAPEMKKEV